MGDSEEEDRRDNFTLEKLKILEKINGVELTLVKLLEKFDSHTKQDHLFYDKITKVIDYHDRLILGSEESDGIKIDLDRLKQKEKTKTGILGAMWVALAALIVKVLWDLVVKRGGI